MTVTSQRVLPYVLGWIVAVGKCAAGSYLRDVELIAPPAPQAALNTVYYYPSYVKGEDPVEEYNRRRLHVDTGEFMEPEDTDTGRPVDRERQSQRQKAHGDGCCAKVKRNYRGRPRARPDPMRIVDAQTDHESNYLSIRKASGGPRYVRDDVEVFDIERGSLTGKRPVRRRTRMTGVEAANVRNGPRRYEESDPQVFAYERSDHEPIDRANSNRPGATEDSQYFQDTFQFQKTPLELEFGHLFESNDGWEERYERQDHQNHRHQGKSCLTSLLSSYRTRSRRFAEIFGDGSFAAGARRGNDQHYLEQLERGSHRVGVFQKKVKWADKKGGFGEHYWDLNHIQPGEHSHR